MIEMDRDEIERLEATAAWRLRLVDANPDDSASMAAATKIEELVEDLCHNDYAPIWTELQSVCNWLAESDAISDYSDLALDYRNRIGIVENPNNGAAFLQALLAIARSLV